LLASSGLSLLLSSMEG